MRDQLRLLEELQRKDARVQEIESLMKTLPQQVRAAELAIEELEKMLAHERAQLAESEAFRKGQEDEQRDAAELLQRAKSKATQVRNLRESGAAQRELEATRRQMDTREEEVQKLSDALKQQHEKIDEHEAKLRGERDALNAQRGLLDKRLAELQVQLEDVRKEREVTAKSLRPDVLKKYGALKVRRGLAVVAVRDGTCSGCNMNIPPQLYNILQRGTSLELCPNCHRIIYWSKLLEEPSADQAASS